MQNVVLVLFFISPAVFFIEYTCKILRYLVLDYYLFDTIPFRILRHNAISAAEIKSFIICKMLVIMENIIKRLHLRFLYKYHPNVFSFYTFIYVCVPGRLGITFCTIFLYYRNRDIAVLDLFLPRISLHTICDREKNINFITTTIILAILPVSQNYLYA